MIKFCTLGDSSYTTKGLALYESLCNTVKCDFTLYWLCIDEVVYNELLFIKEHKDGSSFNKIRPILLQHIEDYDIELSNARNNPASLWGTQYSQFCWCLTPYFMRYLLTNGYVEDDEVLIYLDNDLYFYHSLELLVELMDGKSVAIHRHRFTAPYKIDNPVGEFNVGVVAIRNNHIGNNISNLWAQWLLNPNNEHYELYGTCGDQKYLDLFIPICGEQNVLIFDQHLSYLAPWCYTVVDYLPQRFYVIYKEEKQPVLFYHFSHFNYNIDADTWSDSYKGEWEPAKNGYVLPYYLMYYESIKKIELNRRNYRS